MSGSSSNPSVVDEYPYPSHAFVQNLVTVKLSGKESYNVWKTQMLCLLVSHDMLGFTDGRFVSPDQSSSGSVSGKEKVGDVEAWRRSDALVKGWILGSLSQQALIFVLHRLEKNSDFTAKNLWDELRCLYGPRVVRDKIQQADPKEETTTPAVDSSSKDDEAKKREKLCLDLYEAILEGSWGSIKFILQEGSVTVTDKISINGNTALHVAVGTTKDMKLLERMLEKAPSGELLSLKNSDGSTLLHVAATVGNRDAARKLVDINPDLLFEMDNDGLTPLARALSNMHTDTYLYLLWKSTDTDIELGTLFYPLFSGKSGDELLVNAISAKDFGSAMNLMKGYGTLNSDAALMAIAQNFPPDVAKWNERIYFSEGPWLDVANNCSCSSSDLKELLYLIAVQWPIQMLLWTAVKLKVTSFESIRQRVSSLWGATHALSLACCLIRDSKDSSSQHYYYNNPVLEAARLNACEVVKCIVSYFPNAIWSENEDGHNIIQYAVINRSEQVYNLLYQMSEHKNIYKTIKDSYGNNLLHLAGRLAPTDKLNLITGAALQIQRELQWFKEVEGFVCPLNKIQKNSVGETPKMVFTREHKDLMIEGEKWMKATAESYTITAALITTIVFAAAITLPGGSNEDTGFPIFTNDTAFTIFAVSDAISLFTSTTSLLMFLSILTARFAEQDFLFKLPTKLIIGLTTLFISTTAMIIAFGATLFLVFGQRKPWMLGPIAALTCLPIASFVTLQFPLIADLMCATFGHSIFGKKSDDPFY